MTLNHEDAGLIALAKQGDREAFAELYRRYLPLIYAYVRARLADDRDAEDLTGLVFLRAFQTVSRYKTQGWPYSAFLYRVARNLVIDHYRKTKPNEPLEKADEVLSAEASPDDRLEDGEERRRLRSALAGLPEDYQEVIRLRIMLSLPTSTVAAWLGRGEGAVRVLLYRALKALRQRMDVMDG